MASIFDFIGVDPRSMQQAPRPVTAAIAPTMYDDAIMRRTRSPLPRQMQASMPMPTVLPQSKPAMMPSPYDDAVMRQARNPAPTLLQAAPQPQAEQPAATPAETGVFGGLLGTSFNDPRTQGILAASASLLESGGNRTGAPVGIGQALGRALTAGTAGYSGAQSAEAARKDAEINQQYKLAQAKQMESSATRPILTDLGNGAFTRVTDPVTGESKIVENEDVKNYLAEQAALKAKSKNINVLKITDAQKAADKDFAKDYNEFIVQGGLADINKGLTQLEEAVEILETEGGTGFIEAGLMPDWAQAVTNKSGLRAKELVTEVVQRNLRLVLGAQFTEKEGERLINRAFNPSLSEEENIRRIKRLGKSIYEAKNAKLAAARHYEQFGTLSNFKGASSLSAKDIEAGAGLLDNYDFEVVD
jgi:hypothetical protein